MRFSPGCAGVSCRAVDEQSPPKRTVYRCIDAADVAAKYKMSYNMGRFALRSWFVKMYDNFRRIEECCQ
jgi:hypothetical protein